MGNKKNKSGIPNQGEQLSTARNKIDTFINNEVEKLVIGYLSNDLDKISNAINDIESKIPNFDKYDANIQNKINNYIEKFHLDKFHRLHNLKIEFPNLYSLLKNTPKSDFEEASNNWMILLYFTIRFIGIELYWHIENAHRLESLVVDLHKELKSFNFTNSGLNETQEKILNILNDKFNFIFLKLDLFIPEKIESINIIDLIGKLKNTPYQNAANILLFYKKESHVGDNDIEELAEEIIKKKYDYSGIDYYFLVKYYKDFINDSVNLEKLYTQFKDDRPEQKQNIIFIGNNLLSLLILQYEPIKSNQSVKDKINNLYSELISKQKVNNKNYFTYLKYAEFVIKNLSYSLKNNNISQSEELLKILHELKNTINSIYESRSFYQLPDEEHYLNIDNNILDKIYCPNIININSRHNKDLRVERLESKIEYLEFLVNQNKSLGKQVDKYKIDIDKKFNDSRNSQIEILAIFSAIVLFVSGSVQLYTRLEDLESAIIFTLFFGGTVAIITSLVFRTKSLVKWINLGIAIGLMCVGLFFPKISSYVGYENIELNTNNMKTIKQEIILEYTKLKSTIQDIKNEQQKLDKKINQFKN